MQNHPDGDIDSFLRILNSSKGQVWPYVIQIFLNEKPKVMMIGLIEKRKIELRF